MRAGTASPHPSLTRPSAFSPLNKAPVHTGMTIVRLPPKTA